jgi:hypothetical protein
MIRPSGMEKMSELKRLELRQWIGLKGLVDLLVAEKLSLRVYPETGSSWWMPGPACQALTNPGRLRLRTSEVMMSDSSVHAARVFPNRPLSDLLPQSDEKLISLDDGPALQPDEEAFRRNEAEAKEGVRLDRALTLYGLLPFGEKSREWLRILSNDPRQPDLPLADAPAETGEELAPGSVEEAVAERLRRDPAEIINMDQFEKELRDRNFRIGHEKLRKLVPPDRRLHGSGRHPGNPSKNSPKNSPKL